MKERYYDFDAGRFTALSKQYCKSQPGWKTVRIASTLCFLLGVLCIVGLPLKIGMQDPVGMLLLFAAGIIFGAIPLSIGYVILNQGRIKCGDPFTSMSKVFLYSNRSGIQFGYHDCRKRQLPESMEVWQIAYPNINYVEVDRASQLVKICGNVELVQYDDITRNRVRSSFTKGQLGTGSFKFFLCFTDQQAFFDNLKNNDVEVRFM